jgi:hypothetical protein
VIVFSFDRDAKTALLLVLVEPIIRNHDDDLYCEDAIFDKKERW